MLKLRKKPEAKLAAKLLASLPHALSDRDGGVAEALRRDATLKDGTQQPISLEDFDAAIFNGRRGFELRALSPRP